jgi:hypothetical protein
VEGHRQGYSVLAAHPFGGQAQSGGVVPIHGEKYEAHDM